MPILQHTIPLGALVLVFASSASFASAETPAAEGASVSVSTLQGTGHYPVLTRGQVMLVNGQRLVVTREPLPISKTTEAPPEPQVVELEGNRPPPPSAGSIWVSGHWTHGASGFSWVAGRYVAPRPGHVFVPPRWAVLDEQYLLFSGFFVPRGVFVQSHFNRYYYSGDPRTSSRLAHGPYWPVGLR